MKGEEAESGVGGVGESGGAGMGSELAIIEKTGRGFIGDDDCFGYWTLEFDTMFTWALVS